MWLKFLIVLLTLAFVSSTSYKGFKVYEILPKNIKEIDLLYNLQHNNSNGGYDFWSLAKIPNRPIHLMVSPNNQNKFENLMEKYNMIYTYLHNDVSDYIKERMKLNRQANLQSSYTTQPRSSIPTLSFDQYHNYETIHKYLNDLTKSLPNRVEISLTGKSYQGREIQLIRISNGDGIKDKKLIFIDAGIHAREWIAPATALYVIDQLINNFDENEHLLKNYDWIILPVFNPDGYEYSLNVDPVWRKTRKPYTKDCIGSDANRNFNFHWAETGTEFDACSEIFHGSVAFSEPETVFLKTILDQSQNRIKMYLTLHSVGPCILYPWGWTSELPETWEDMDEIAQAAAKAIRDKTGSEYMVGSSTNVLYSASGGSDDYAYGKSNIPIAFTIELNGRSFHPEPPLILDLVKESWIGIKTMAEKLIVKYP